MENSLEKIAKEEESTVNRMVEIVTRTKEIQAKMKKNLERKTMSVLIDILLESDRDKNFMYSPMEIQMLCIRLQRVEGVHFNEEKFRKLLPEDEREHVPLHDVIKVVYNLKDPTIPEEEKVFSIHEEDLMGT